MAKNEEKQIDNLKDIVETKHKNDHSIFRLIGKEIWRDKIALISLIIFLGLVMFTFVAEALMDNDVATKVHITRLDRRPSEDHILGTDNGGRDMIDMMIIGAKNTFKVAFGVTGISMVIGLFVGIMAGFWGGHTDNALMRVTEFFMMVPTLMIIIVIVSILSRYSVLQFILIMSSLMWMGRARLIRTVTLQQRNLDYVHASKTLGTPNLMIMMREVFPNLTSVIMTNLTLSLAGAMGVETGLSFLGFGLPFNTPSLGRLITVAREPAALQNRWWQWLPPAVLIFIIMLCINYVGDAVSRAVDPKQRRA